MSFTPWTLLLHHEPVAELTAPLDPHLHFNTFGNSIFDQKPNVRESKPN